MRTRFLIAVVGFVLLVLATAALWTTDARRASNIHPEPERLDTGASVAVPLAPPQRISDPAAPARGVVIAPTLRASTRIDTVPASADSEEPEGWFDHPEHRFFGSVRSRCDGKPIASAQITCSDRFTTMSSSISDATGSYEANTSVASSVSLTCRATGWQTVSRIIDADGSTDTLVDFTLDPATEMIVRLQDRAGRPLFESMTDTDLEIARALRPVFVDGHVSRGARLSGNVISLRATSLGDAHTDGWYRVTLDTDMSGTCCLAFGDHVVDVVSFTSKTSEIVLAASREDLESSTGSLRLTIVDSATSAPIPGLRVRVTPSFGAVRTVKPDLRGGVCIEGLPEGDAKVEIAIDTAGDFQPFHSTPSGWAINGPLSTDTIAIRAGVVSDLGRKTIEHVVSISGWVDVAPNRDGSGSVFAMHEDETGSVRVEVARSDADGKFRFTGLNCGYYRVGSHMLADAQTVLVDARFADVTGVHITASKGDSNPIGTSRK